MRKREEIEGTRRVVRLQCSSSFCEEQINEGMKKGKERRKEGERERGQGDGRGKVLDSSMVLGKFWQGPREISKEKEHDVFLISHHLRLLF